MNVSENGLNLIREFEGCKLEAYQDSVGVWTVGYGSTRGVCSGLTITQEDADRRLQNDVQGAVLCVKNAVKVNVTQNQFDALVSFVFNLGCGALRNSQLLRKLNDMDDEGAASEFGKWNHGGGQVLAGLTRRREAEAELFGA